MKKNVISGFIGLFVGVLFLTGCSFKQGQFIDNKEVLKTKKEMKVQKGEKGPIKNNAVAENGTKNKINNQNNKTIEKSEIKPSEKPKVEVFVMSYCPFGTQFEKGIIPVMKLLKDKADIQIKFVDYVMHGPKEIKENINQYCIEKNEPNKYVDYLECFLKEGKADQCLTLNEIDEEKLGQCINKTRDKFKLIEGEETNQRYPKFGVQTEENKKYGVKGSPTLVINGKTIKNARRDSASLLSVICSAFTKQPEECKKVLSSQTPASGFGTGTVSASSSGGGCGN